MSATLLDDTLTYAARGWSVLPVHSIQNGQCTCGNANCNSPGKHPATKHGVKDTTTDENQIRQWWRERPRANIGVATGPASSIFVVDLDAKNNGFAKLEALASDHEEGIGQPLVQQTGGGGLHLVYAYPSEGRIASRSAVRGLAGIDVRGEGGYIVAEPSFHVSGRPYAWLDDALSRDPSPAPAWLLELVGDGEPKHSRTEREASTAGWVDVAELRAALAHVDPDPRDSWLRVGFALHDTIGHGLTDESAYDVWTDWSKRSTKYDPADQERTWRSMDPTRSPDAPPVTIGTIYFLARLAGWRRPAASTRPGPRADPEAGEQVGEVEGDGAPYFTNESGTFWRKETRDGPVPVRLANFSATIVRDMQLDDGAEQRRTLDLLVRIGGRQHSIEVPAERFSGMTWPLDQLGAGAIVAPGQGSRDHLRVAIQELSQPEAVCLYGHTGWRLIDGRHVYLHGGGAIGAPAGVSIGVRLPPALEPMVLPDPPRGAELRDAVRASLRILELGQQRITIPLLAATYAAPLGIADWSLFLVGETGVWKTELAALAQQHFGTFTARSLPGSWSSTDNALEDLLFVGKDVVLVIDDYVGVEDQRAERILRAQGNRSGRQRMRPDTTLRPPRPPRALTLVTGEDLPRRHSLLARCAIDDVRRGDIVGERLTSCQAEAASGLYAMAMAGYIAWLAQPFDARMERARVERERLRREVGAEHARTSDVIAALGAALRMLIDFALVAGTLDQRAADALADRGQQMLLELAAAQAERHVAVEPASRFLRLLRTALVARRATLASIGDAVLPGEPARQGSPSSGPVIGWVDDGEILLDPGSSYTAAQREASLAGEPSLPTAATLRARLHEKGYLAAVETRGGSTRFVIRKVIRGRRLEVLHVRREALLPEHAAT